MKKKELLKISLPVTDGAVKADADTVYLHAVVCDGILAVSLHDGRDLARGDTGPSSVSYIDRREEKWTSWRRDGDGISWTGCRLDNLFPCWRRRRVFFSDGEAAGVLAYLGAVHDGTSDPHAAALREIGAYEEEKAALRSRSGGAARDCILAGENAMKDIPDAPEGLEDWIHGVLLKPKLIYGECPGEPKKVRIRCTACGGSAVITKRREFRRRADLECPLCGRTVTALGTAGRRSGFDAGYVKVAVLQRVSDDVYVWRYYTAGDYTDIAEGTWRRSGMTEAGRDFLTITGGKVLYARYEYLHRYGRMRWLPAKDNGEYVRWSQMETVCGLQRYAYGSVIYPGNLDVTLGGDDRFRYFPLKAVAEGNVRRDTWRHFEYSLENYLLFPKVELLIKVGLLNVASAFLTSFPYWFDDGSRMNPGAGDLLGILGLRTRTSLAQLRRFDSLEALEIIQDAERKGAALTDAELRKRISWRGMLGEGNRLKQLEDAGCDARRFMRYAERETGSKRLGREAFARFADMYIHYVDALRFLEVRLDRGNRYPSQLGKLIPSIDRQVELRNRLLEMDRLRELNDGIRRTASRIEEMLLGMGMEAGSAPGTFVMSGNGSLCVCLPHSKEDLSSEGSHLDHCVGRQGYDLRMARGETVVIFLRRQSRPDTSFYTMEVNMKTGELVQCRTHGNGSYDELLPSGYEVKREVYAATSGRTSLRGRKSLLGRERDEILRLAGYDTMGAADRQFAEAVAAVVSSDVGSYDSDLRNLHLTTEEYVSSARFFTAEDFLPVLRRLRKAKEGRREVYRFAKRFERDLGRMLKPA